MDFPDLIALALWPLAALGIWLWRKALQFRPNDYRRRLVGTYACLMVITPAIIVMLLIPHHSTIVVAVEQTLLVAIGVLLLLAAWKFRDRRIGAIVTAILGTCVVVGGLVYFVGDIVLRQKQVDGWITDRRYESKGYACRKFGCEKDYFVTLKGRRYLATAVVFEKVQIDQHYRAHITRFSGRILSVEAMRF